MTPADLQGIAELVAQTLAKTYNLGAWASGTRNFQAEQAWQEPQRRVV